MNLAHLSIARVGNHRKVPRVLTNDERMRAYRALTPVQFANSYFTPTPDRSPISPPRDAGDTGEPISEVSV